MNTQTVTVIKSMSAETANANYQIESCEVNGALTRISATVSSKTVSIEENNYIGNIYFENGNVSCGFPSSVKISPFFDDFQIFLTEIESSIQAQGDNYITV